MAVASSRAVDPVTAELSTKNPHRRALWSIGAAFVVGAALIAGSFFVGNSRGESSTDAKQVVAAATDFAATYNSYDATQLEEYQGRVSGLLTDSYNDQFLQVTEAFFDVLKDKKQVSKDADVQSVAIESLDGDSAEVLVAVDATITNTDVEDAAGIVRRFRWRVSMTQDGGSWKVANYESIASVDATTAPSDGAADGGDGQ